MAFPWHDYVDMFTGDDWTIAGLLLAQDNLPCDLTGATISWILVDPNGFVSLTEGAYTVNVLDPPTDGRIVVRVAASNTAALSAGRFTDGLRMIAADGTSTMWEGQIGVNITPFGATIGGSDGGGGIPIAYYVLRTGDTMSGPLTLSADPTAPLHAAPKQYVDAAIAAGGGTPGGGTPGGATTQVQFNDGGVFGGDPDFTYDKTTGGLSTKAIYSAKVTLSAAPANPMEAATKQYVDAARLQPPGAVGDGVTDDTAAIQLAVDKNAYPWYFATGLSGGAVTQMSARNYRTTGPIHLGYGTGYSAGRIQGDGSGFYGESAFGTVLKCDFSNAPGICVQGGRRNTISKLCFLGKNLTWLQTTRDTNIANWIDPTLAATANSRYAPYAAIAVDPYTGATPTPAYPSVTYPAFLGGGITQYSKSPTSNVLISDCDITGFVVGVVVQPNGDSQGDFVRFRDVSIDSCAYGISVGNTQSRNVGMQDVLINNVHTAITNTIHGVGNGRLSSTFMNIHVGNSIQVFNVSTSVGGPITFISLYSELGYMIGSVSGATAVETSITMQDICMQFDKQNTGAFGVPTYLLDSTLNTSIIIQHGYFNYFFGVAFINAPIDKVDIDGTLMQPAAPSRTLQHEWFAHNALAGGLMFKSCGWPATPRLNIHPKFVPFNLDSGAGLSAIVLADIAMSKRDRCTPLWARKHTGLSDDNIVPVDLPSRVNLFDTASQVTAVSLVGRTLTFTLPGSLATEDYVRNGPLPGDVLLHNDSGTVFFVSAKAGSVITAKMQNNYKSDLTPIIPLIWTTGLLFVGNSRVYSPQYTIFGNFTAASNVITNVGRPDGYAGDIENQIAVGDYILYDYLVDDILGPFVSVARVTARDNTAHTITLSSPASRTVAAKRLGTFIRAAATG